MKREVLQSNVADVSFVEGHGKQRAGVYYNIAKKAEMTNNHRAAKARQGNQKCLEDHEIPPRTQEVPMTITPTVA